MCTKAKRAAFWLPVLLISTVFAAGSSRSLVEAVKTQNKQAVGDLLRGHADVNGVEPDGATALHWAAHWDDSETARKLIDAGAQVNVRNELGITPLLLACSNGSRKMIQLLL